MEEGNASHRAQGVDVWSLQSYGDAVEEDKDQHHVVEHFVGNDLLAHHSEPAARWDKQIRQKFGSGIGSSPKAFCSCATSTSPGGEAASPLALAMIIINY